jgi:hypothetical protein
MTTQEFISMASSSWNMPHLLYKLGVREDTQQTRTTYVYPLAIQAGLTMEQVRDLFLSNVNRKYLDAAIPSGSITN